MALSKQTPETIALWSKAIREANEAAKAASTNEDGGTCNMDSVTIDFKGWKKADIDKLPLIGIKLSSGFWKGSYFINTASNGQGNNRSRMVKAAVEKLKEHGLPAYMYYQMD